MSETKPLTKSTLGCIVVFAIVVVAAFMAAIMLVTPGSPLSSWLFYSPAPSTDPLTLMFRATAGELIDEFHKNTASANVQYGGKKGQMTGKVVAVRGSGASAEVQVGESKWSLSYVTCRYHISAAGSAISLKPGDDVVLIGTLEKNNAGFNLTMTDCVPVERK